MKKRKTRSAAYPISQHVVVQCSARFQPDSFPGVFIGEKQPIVRRWKVNRKKNGRQSDDEAITDTARLLTGLERESSPSTGKCFVLTPQAATGTKADEEE